MPAVTYTVAMPDPHAHLYHVAVEIDGVAGPTLDLALPAWTPGSYMIREYARHVQAFAAEDGGRALPWRKVDKATWRIETGGASRVRVAYQVYANELSVRTSHLDGSHGYFNPATVCMYAAGRTHEPLAVRVIVPSEWQVTTGLEASRASNVETFNAADYDELVNSPFECGTHRLLEFEVDGLPHRIALWGHGNEDEARLVEDTRTIVVAARDMFGGLPYRDYTFIVHLANSRGGGLEHRNSVSMIVDRWTFQPAAAYERYLGLAAHEFFHVWNVKRIRPAPLGPFDYSRENYTRQLWTMEGVTDYYTSRLLLWAGLITPQRYLERVAEQITALQSQPGRLVQSLEQSSFDAWIKLYRPDENTHNSSISYYLKGALVGLLLDLEIRRRTGGARSLDDVVRLLFERYQRDGASFPEQGGYQAAVEQVAESSFADFFGSYVAGTDELDYAGALGCAGLQLSWGYEKAPEDGGAPAWLGLITRSESGRLKVTQARADGPAYAAGIYAGDELLALDGFRLDEERLKARLAERRPGDGVTLTLFRRDELLHLPVTLAAAPHDTLTIEQVAEPTAEQRQIYEGWLGPWEAS